MTQVTPTREQRIFLACSAELSEERKGFAKCIERIGEFEHVRRNVDLVPITWEENAFGGSSDIDSAIQDSTAFERTAVLVVVVWNKVGPGTYAEWNRALALWKQHRRPGLLVFARTPAPGVDPQPLEKFRQEVIDAGFVPNQYDEPEEFFERLQEQLPKVIPALIDPLPVLDPPTSVLRDRYIRASAISVALAIAALTLSRMVGYPGTNFNQYSALAIISATPVLAAAFAWSAVGMARLLDRFDHAWRSPHYLDVPLARDFRGVLPRIFFPAYLRARIQSRWLDEIVAILALAIVFLAPPIAQVVCVIGEMASEWHVAVSWDPGPGEKKDDIPPSKFVENGWRTWLFGLQGKEIRDRLAREDQRIIYVYAHGQFGSDPSPRSNLGPQVWLPAQTWLYLLLVLGELCTCVWLFGRMLAIARTGSERGTTVRTPVLRRRLRRESAAG